MQLVIALTGNYAFFNLLTIALCLFLLDDDALRRVVGPYRVDATAPARTGTTDDLDRRRRRHRSRIVRDVCRQLSLVAAGLGSGCAGCGPHRSVSQREYLRALRRHDADAPEIIVEGSDDGEHWLAYEFKYKPGDVRGVRPGSPRTSRGSTGRCGLPRWKDTSSRRGIEVSACDCFRDRRRPGAVGEESLLQPSAAIRARHVIPYRMTDAATRRATGAWWTREPLGEYSPPISLEPGQ
jgi:hypothetical protein